MYTVEVIRVCMRRKKKENVLDAKEFFVLGTVIRMKQKFNEQKNIEVGLQMSHCDLVYNDHLRYIKIHLMHSYRLIKILLHDICTEKFYLILN